MMAGTMFQTFLHVGFLFSWARADHLTIPEDSINNMVCDLECRNNGVCRFLTKDPMELQKKMQSGHMVLQCLCPLGYRGMGCDVNVQDDPEDCQGMADGLPRCQCATADRLSKFAGEQCRKPYTEFCAGLRNSVGRHISFCTNGGKCRDDLLGGGHRSSGNASDDVLFQHAGCVCPPEFQGEHCELLNKDYHPSHYHQQQQPAPPKRLSNGMITLLTFSVGVLGVLLVRRMRRNRATLRSLPITPVELALNAPTYYRDSDGDDLCYREEPQLRELA